MQNGDTPLLMAVHNGHLAVVKMLIEKYKCSANEVYQVNLESASFSMEMHDTCFCTSMHELIII